MNAKKGKFRLQLKHVNETGKYNLSIYLCCGVSKQKKNREEDAVFGQSL